MLAELIGRPYAAVTNCGTHLQLTTKYEAWTPVQDAMLRKGFFDTPLDLLAKQIKRTPMSCQLRASKLGLIEASAKPAA